VILSRVGKKESTKDTKRTEKTFVSFFIPFLPFPAILYSNANDQKPSSHNLIADGGVQLAGPHRIIGGWFDNLEH
jgi:hypothetical protein